MKSTLRSRTSAATVWLPKASGQGVLVPGGFILTAAHAVPWDGSGSMTLGDHFLVRVRPHVGAEFRLSVHAVEPVADIAVLGGPDNQVFYDDANAFEDFVEATEAVPVCTRDFAAGAVPVQVLTHQRTWTQGTATDTADGCAWLEASQRIEGGTSGGPVVDDEAQLVGVISHNCEEPPFDGRMPRPHRALPGWVWNRIAAAQGRGERP